MAKITSLPPIDFSNLHSKEEKIAKRYEGLREFHSFFRGLLLGVVLTIPIQLFLKPIAFQQGEILYGSKTVLSGINPGIYGASVIAIFGIILVMIPLGYRWARNLTNWETVRLQTYYGHDDIFSEAKEPLKEMCEDLNLDYTAKDNVITCQRKSETGKGLSLTSNNNKKVLELKFDTTVSILHVGFAPEYPHSETLLRELENHFKEGYPDSYGDQSNSD